MQKHLTEYVICQPHHRFVLVEKRNELAEIFISSIESSGWTDVIYADNDVLIMANEKSKQIMLIAHTISDKIESGNVFNFFSAYTLEDSNINFHMSIIFDVEYNLISQHFKIPEFINWYLSTVSMCMKAVKPIKELMKKYNTENSNYREIEKETISIRMNLQENNKKLTDSLYEKSNKEFFDENGI
jgi:hypothetical protein